MLIADEMSRSSKRDFLFTSSPALFRVSIPFGAAPAATGEPSARSVRPCIIARRSILSLPSSADARSASPAPRRKCALAAGALQGPAGRPDRNASAEWRRQTPSNDRRNEIIPTCRSAHSRAWVGEPRWQARSRPRQPARPELALPTWQMPQGKHESTPQVATTAASDRLNGGLGDRGGQWSAGAGRAPLVPKVEAVLEPFQSFSSSAKPAKIIEWP